MEHLSQEQLDALVMGTASPEDAAVQQHLAICEACARRLLREAQLESELYDAAVVAAREVTVARARPAPAQRWRVALSVAAALAVVAFGTWSLLSRKGPEVSPPRVATGGGSSTNSPAPAGPRNPSRGAPELPLQEVRKPSRAVHGLPLQEVRTPSRAVHELPLQDVCRCVTVERGQGPPTDPGDSRLCTPPPARGSGGG